MLVDVRAFAPSVRPRACLAAAARSPTLATSRVMPLAEVRPGMEGEGRTVFEGARDRRVRRADPGRPRERARPAAEPGARPPRRAGRSPKTGVIAGMSGSPVFIDGRLAGRRGLRLPVRQGADRRHHAHRRDDRGHAAPGAAGGLGALPLRRPRAACARPSTASGEGRAAAAAARGRARGASGRAAPPRSPGPRSARSPCPSSSRDSTAPPSTGRAASSRRWASRRSWAAAARRPAARAAARPRSRRRRRHLAHRGRPRPVGDRHRSPTSTATASTPSATPSTTSARRSSR